MNDSPEPSCPKGRTPHRERIKKLQEIAPPGKLVAVCVDDEPEYINYYLHELSKYPDLTIVSHESLGGGVYCIKVRKN